MAAIKKHRTLDPKIAGDQTRFAGLMKAASDAAEREDYKSAVGLVDEALSIRPGDKKAQELRKAIVNEQLWSLVEAGFAGWSGGKPKGSKNPIRLSPGPSISEMIREMRR